MATTTKPRLRASDEVAAILAELKSLGSEENRAGQARFGINARRAYGVSMPNLQSIKRRLKRDHDLAAALWETGVHEARILAALVDEPRKVTPAQMDSWAADFDSWDLCDQVTSKLFVRTLHAEKAVKRWVKDNREFVRRAAFALLAAHTVHGKDLPDSDFLQYLPLIEKYATDPRNFVRKAVNWALRQIGKHSLALHAPALALAQKLAASDDKTARWIGKDAARELSNPVQIARLKARRTKS